MKRATACISFTLLVVAIVCAWLLYRSHVAERFISDGDPFYVDLVPDGIEIYVPGGSWLVRTANLDVNITKRYAAKVEIRPGVTHVRREELLDESGHAMDPGVQVRNVGISFSDDQLGGYDFSWVGGDPLKRRVFPVACLARTREGVEVYVPAGSLPGQASITVNNFFTKVVEVHNGITAIAKSEFRDSQGRPPPDGIPFLTAKITDVPSGMTAYVEWKGQKT